MSKPPESFDSNNSRPRHEFSHKARAALAELAGLIKNIDAGDVNTGQLRAQMWGLIPPDTVPDDIMELPHKKANE